MTDYQWTGARHRAQPTLANTPLFGARAADAMAVSLRRGGRVDEWGDTFTVDHADGLAAILARVRPAWMRHAACAGMDQDLFFPPRGDAGDDAKRICEGCPVRANCLEWGLTAEVGIFGGVALRDRQKLNVAGWQLGDPLPPVKFRNTGVSHGTEGGAKMHRAVGEKLCPICAAHVERRRARVRRNDAKRAAVHGTVGKYNSGCRCDECGAARSAFDAARRLAARATILPADDPRHGTDNGYTTFGCRCEPCKTARAGIKRHLRAVA